jgi:hypothetical protein
MDAIETAVRAAQRLHAEAEAELERRRLDFRRQSSSASLLGGSGN